MTVWNSENDLIACFVQWLQLTSCFFLQTINYLDHISLHQAVSNCFIMHNLIPCPGFEVVKMIRMVLSSAFPFMGAGHLCATSFCIHMPKVVYRNCYVKPFRRTKSDVTIEHFSSRTLLFLMTQKSFGHDPLLAHSAMK